MSSSSAQKQILILGAGVTGLQTALSLLTSSPSSPSPPYSVTILASHFPGDLSPAYTSPWAGGHWRSHASSSEEDEKCRAWDARTYAAWKKLLSSDSNASHVSAQESGKRVGLGVKESRNFWGKESEETSGLDGSGLWWSKPSVVDDFHVLGESERPRDSVMGVRYSSICINVPRYLAYLLERVQELGARIVKAEVETNGGLEDVVRDAKRKAEVDGVWAFVNCTGLSARHFLDRKEAEKLYPIRGQTLLVRGEARMARTYTGLSGETEELLYVIPRPGSETTILGGCKQVGNWSTEIDGSLSRRILERVSEYGLAEELRTAKDGGFEVLSTQVGFRPGRKGGPRVEVEGRVGGSWLVHSYGHAGAGYQNSVGCAEYVVELIRRLEQDEMGRAKL